MKIFINKYNRVYYLRFIKLLFLAPALISILFLALNSRPTADEYFIGAAFRGFYIDAPNNTLFISKSIFLDYINAIISFSNLGWDNFFNAATFQMSSAILLNFFGPGSSLVLSLFYSIILLFMFYMSLRILFITRSKIDLLVKSGFILIALYLFFLLSNYPNSSVTGIFVLTGIRIGTYLIYGIILWTILTYIVSYYYRKNLFDPKLILKIIFVPLIFSFWYSTYYAICLFLFALIIYLDKKSKVKSILMFLISLVSVCVIFLINYGVFFPKVEGYRSLVSQESIVELIPVFFREYVLNFDSRLYSPEYLNLFVNLNNAIPFIIGFFLINWDREDISHTSRLKSLKILSSILLGLYFILPLIFVFQEFVTYQAYWHLTIVFTISFITYLALGMRFRAFFRSKNFEYKVFNYFIGSIVLFFSIQGLDSVYKKIYDQIEVLQNFSNSWDRGNTFSVGFPVENTSNYNVNNFISLKPYVNYSEIPQWVYERNQTFVLGGTLDSNQEFIMGNDSFSAKNISIEIVPFVLPKIRNDFEVEILLKSNAPSVQMNANGVFASSKSFEKSDDYYYSYVFDVNNTLIDNNKIKIDIAPISNDESKLYKFSIQEIQLTYRKLNFG
jgi:hypothetical protein